MQDREERLLANLAGMLKGGGWDQRAKNLLDKNIGEPDARRAIRRLHRALRYGRTDIQACKAFEELGSRYEQLHNSRLALHYYTKAIRLALDLEVDLILILYRRGRVHYSRGEFEAACRDFGWALELDTEHDFFRDERQVALKALAERNKQA